MVEEIERIEDNIMIGWDAVLERYVAHIPEWEELFAMARTKNNATAKLIKLIADEILKV